MIRGDDLSGVTRSGVAGGGGGGGAVFGWWRRRTNFPPIPIIITPSLETLYLLPIRTTGIGFATHPIGEVVTLN